ncbi:MAG: UDP-4-amino-4-deoxy-L-arabinose aminotransferase [Desulfobacterales bacterium]|nr:UDP-4-amino-4-deoxy-L-arabinose aminotransferase [Desulfobacterales bacterium]MBF0396935.1 UDP-4-amino-4-deoxy-L-arabinose aminotransferase [Desulfobacterales bacterium]
MRKSFLPFSKPSITEGDISAVCDVMRSGWITTGTQNSIFENKICEYTGSKSAVALSSATAGMHLIFHALKLEKGDEVITPSMTWVSTVNLIVLYGAKPVFADIDKDTLMISKETIEPLITSNTKLIIPVHFAGASFDIDPIKELAVKKNISLIEDSAHAIGTKYKGNMIGKTGTSVFSFHPIKNITTGEGGIICSEDTSLIEKLRRLKFHGLGVDAYDRMTQGRAPLAEVLEPGFKYNLPDMAAVLGIKQLERISDLNDKRTQLANYYRESLKNISEIIPLSLPKYDIKHSWHLFIVRVNSKKINRNEFMTELKNRNIGTGLHFQAVHLHKYYREVMGFSRGMLPNTEYNSDRICSLPLFPDMTFEDVDDVVNAIKDILK